MFNPSRDQARQFIIDAWQKRRQRLPASALEIAAADIIEMHPEYHALLETGGAAREQALERDWSPQQGEINPFLHLSLHLAIEEQLSIDQPPGIVTAFSELLAQAGDRHDALHDVLEALVETLWRSQRDGTPLDSTLYLDLLRRAAGRG